MTTTPAEYCRLYGCCDEIYLRRYGIAFAMAAAKQGWPLHLSAVVEHNNEARLSGLLELLSQAHTVVCEGAAAMSWSLTQPWRPWSSQEERRVILACQRFFCVGTELAQQPGSILIADVDALVRQPPNTAPSDHGVGLYIRDFNCDSTRDDWLRVGTAVNAGLVHVHNNDDSKRFLQSLQATIQSLPLQWYVDQAALLMTHQSLKSAIHFHLLNHSHLGWGKDQSCLLWSAKGERKTGNRMYLKRKARLLKAFGKALAQI